MPLKNNTDISVAPCVVYDPLQREYYNHRTDIFLTDDDISFLKLRPYTHITNPLPNPLPVDYFTNWEKE